MAHWYYVSGGERMGPISEGELRTLVRGGTLNAASLVYGPGMTEWTPAGRVQRLIGDAPPRGLQTAAPSGRSVRLEERQLIDPSEGTAFGLLCAAAAITTILLLLLLVGTFGGLLLFVILGLAAMAIRHGLARAYYRTSAIEVTETQFREIHDAAAALANSLGRPLPSIYVVQDSLWNAFAMRLLGRPMVVLNSMMIDSILLRGDTNQLAFVVGHELGHHYAGHLGWKHVVANLGGWFVWGRLWWSRRCEFTCDRYGLVCAGSLGAAQRAVCNMAAGAQLASRVNLEAAAQQWRNHSGELFVRYLALYSSHPHLLHRLTELSSAAAQLGVRQ